MLIETRARAVFEAVAAAHPPAARYALLDFPDYANVGDSLIWLGAVDALRALHKRDPAYVCTTWSYDPRALARAAPDGPIYLSGGGNFGDLWPRFQHFRLEVMRDFPDRPIIQLPQTIKFEDPVRREETQRAIAAHGRFSLMVRDAKSLKIAQDFDCPSALVPDLAFRLGPMARPKPPETPIACLVRTDKEAARPSGGRRVPEGVRVFDWIDKPRTTEAVRLAQKALMAAHKAGGERGLPLAWRWRARAALARGAALLSQGEVVVTDRLHGHIYCLLLGIPHAVLDNSYGKISSFVAQWTREHPLVHVAGEFEEAIAWARAVARRAAA